MLRGKQDEKLPIQIAVLQLSALCGWTSHLQSSHISDLVERAVTVAEHEGLAKTAERVVIASGIPNRDPETKRLIASARQGAIGVIYPDLPWLMRFNSRPINAGRYLIGWRGLSESLRKRICGCALLP